MGGFPMTPNFILLRLTFQLLLGAPYINPSQDMSHFASLKDPGEGTVFSYDHVWDSDMIFGW